MIEENKLNFKIGNKIIGPGQQVLVVAEISCNHQQSFEKTKEMVKKSAEYILQYL